MLASRFTDYRVHRDKYSWVDVGTKEQPSPHEVKYTVLSAFLLLHPLYKGTTIILAPLISYKAFADNPVWNIVLKKYALFRPLPA